MTYVHLTKAECDALKFLNTPRRTFKQLKNHLGLYQVSVSSLLRKLIIKSLISVERTKRVGGFYDGKSLSLFTSNVTPEEASELLGLSVLSDSMGGQVKSTYRWLRSWMKVDRAKHLMRESKIWETRPSKKLSVSP